jgi:hypothetical protein
MTENMKIKQYKNGIYSSDCDGLIHYHATPDPHIPFPFRVNQPNSMVNEKEFSSFVRSESGNGFYNAVYTTHDVFMNQGSVSPLTHQVGYLLRVLLRGKVEIREEEVIYNSFDELIFDYYSFKTNTAISHQNMMSIVKTTATEIRSVMEYFEHIDTNLQDQLNRSLLGMYPREIWRSFDLVSLSKVP